MHARTHAHTHTNTHAHTSTHTHICTHTHTHIYSAVSGLTSALLGTPADVIKSRIMNQPYDDSGRGLYYRSSIDCLTKTVSCQGHAHLSRRIL